MSMGVDQLDRDDAIDLLQKAAQHLKEAEEGLRLNDYESAEDWAADAISAVERALKYHIRHPA